LDKGFLQTATPKGKAHGTRSSTWTVGLDVFVWTDTYQAAKKHSYSLPQSDDSSSSSYNLIEVVICFDDLFH